MKDLVVDVPTEEASGQLNESSMGQKGTRGRASVAYHKLPAVKGL